AAGGRPGRATRRRGTGCQIEGVIMSVQRFSGLLGWICTVGAAPLAAQAPWLPAACDIKPGHQLVNSGMQSLRSAFSTKFADQKTKDLKDAERSLTQAVTSGKQEKNPAAWYYLGRYYLMVHDVAGADSALSKALALAPACKEDIGLYRRQEWVGVFNAGVQAWQGGQTDSAIASFRRANQIYQAEPMGFVYIANLFVGREQPDSAGADDLFTAAGSMLGAIPNSPDTAVMDADCGKAAKKKTPALTARQVAARCAPAAADTMRKYHVLVDPQYAMVAKTYQAG